MAEIEERSPCIVEKHTERPSTAELQKKGDALVEWICGFLPTEAIGIPHHVALPGTIQRSRLVSKTEEMIVRFFVLIDTESGAGPAYRFSILLEKMAFHVGQRDEQIRPNRDPDLAGMASVMFRHN